MGWLSGWNKRREITISNTNIDSTLTWFPLNLLIGTSVGTGDDDVSSIFDELTSDANRKKIAVTKADGTTELKVEIERWDDANEKASLWVSADGWEISDSGTTTIYFYYDSSHADNANVGDIGSATDVWDSNFKGVWHLDESGDGSAGEFVDSTSNDNDGTGGSIESGGGDSGKTPNQTSGIMSYGHGQLFTDTNSDCIDLGNPSELDFSTGNFTVEGWVNKSSVTIKQAVYAKGGDNAGGIRYALEVGETTQHVPCLLLDDNDVIDGKIPVSGDDVADNGSWHYLVGLRNGTNLYTYVDFVQDGSNTCSANYDLSGTSQRNAYIGCIISQPDGSGIKFFNGSIDEVRVSNTNRSVAWLKATYYTNKDELVNWGSEEETTGPAGVKTINETAIASVKTIQQTAIASVKTIQNSAA